MNLTIQLRHLCFISDNIGEIAICPKYIKGIKLIPYAKPTPITIKATIGEKGYVTERIGAFVYIYNKSEKKHTSTMYEYFKKMTGIQLNEGEEKKIIYKIVPRKK